MFYLPQGNNLQQPKKKSIEMRTLNLLIKNYHLNLCLLKASENHLLQSPLKPINKIQWNFRKNHKKIVGTQQNDSEIYKEHQE